MLITYHNESTRAAYGATSDRSRLDMREGASRNSSFLSRCCSALIDIAAVVASVLLICATGVGITVAIYFLLFCKF
jgi:hypothetical protein